MLENMNDYLSVLAVMLIFLLIGGVALYFMNLKKIEENVRKEVQYYDYEKRKEL
ncbi:MAG: hypothetical protein Q4C64_00060 [Erysipelotrichia bacterium]|nr:hypothetical protein [Erysipelotrichia bacterium]